MSTVKAPPRPRRNPASVRINLRMAPAIKSVLLQAARLRELNLSEFMIQSSQAAAEIALADRTRFVLPPGKWQEFNAALDAPPRSIPALKQFLSEPGIFEKKP